MELSRMSRKGRVGWKELEVAAGWESFSSKGGRQQGEMKASSGVEERSTVHDSALRLCISYFPHRCDEILDKRQLIVRKVILRRNMVHHDVEGRMAGAWGRWSHCIFSQEAWSDEYWCLTFFLFFFYLVFQARAQVYGQCLLFGELNWWTHHFWDGFGEQNSEMEGSLNSPVEI